MEEERYSVIGKPVPRVDAVIKTKGEAVYTTDLSLLALTGKATP